MKGSIHRYLLHICLSTFQIHISCILKKYFTLFKVFSTFSMFWVWVYIMNSDMNFVQFRTWQLLSEQINSICFIHHLVPLRCKMHLLYCTSQLFVSLYSKWHSLPWNTELKISNPFHHRSLKHLEMLSHTTVKFRTGSTDRLFCAY